MCNSKTFELSMNLLTNNSIRKSIVLDFKALTLEINPQNMKNVWAIGFITAIFNEVQYP